MNYQLPVRAGRQEIFRAGKPQLFFAAQDAYFRQRLSLNGPWNDEPDIVLFTYNNLKCAIVRNPFCATLNGYVAVDKGHPLFGAGYYDVYDTEHAIAVHGGLTYAADHLPVSKWENTPPGGVKKAVAEFDDGRSWWFGFDTLHFGDFSPALDTNMADPFSGVYRDIAYVLSEVAYLADQLAAI